MKKLHESRRREEGGFRVVGDIKSNEQIGESHDPQTDLSRLFCHAIDVRKREAVAIDHIVEEAYGDGNGFGQSDEVDSGAGIRSCDEVGYVDGTEGTGFIGQKRLFTARVGRLDGAKARGGIGPIDRV